MATYNGTAGKNTYTGTALLDMIYGNGGDDILNGGAGDDTIDGGAGNDILRGDAGNDTLRGGIGNDSLNGGAGDDTLDGGDGIDTAFYSASTAGAMLSLTGYMGTENGFAMTSDLGFDILSNVENIVGTNFADEITGNDGNNVLNGMGGNDVIYGGGGNDRLIGGLGADELNGGDGIDTVSYAAATASVTVILPGGYGQGAASGDTYSSIENVIGGTKNDIILGDNNANVLDGGAGNDTITDGGGADTVFGGIGNDWIKAVAGDDDTFHGGVGIDILDYSLLLNEEGVTEGVLFMTTFTEHAGSVDTISGFERFIGSQYDDVFVGGAGSQGFFGGAGNDVFRSYGGLDVMTGGAGFDTFVFHRSDVVSSSGVHLGYDTIHGFNKDEDVIDLSGIFTGRDISSPTSLIRVATSGGNTVLSADFGEGAFKNVAVLTGVTGVSVAQLLSLGAVSLEDTLI